LNRQPEADIRRERPGCLKKSIGEEKLVVSHPNRFILGFDNTRAKLWSDIYIDQIKLWRRALSKLPRDVAEKVAYRNAERLWHLPKITTDKGG